MLGRMPSGFILHMSEDVAYVRGCRLINTVVAIQRRWRLTWLMPSWMKWSFPSSVMRLYVVDAIILFDHEMVDGFVNEAPCWCMCQRKWRQPVDKDHWWWPWWCIGTVARLLKYIIGDEMKQRWFKAHARAAMYGTGLWTMTLVCDALPINYFACL